MAFRSDEVNYLVYRYLQESGFTHSAYTFGIESHIDSSNINGEVVPPAALLNIIQKGLQYTEAEICIGEDGVERSIGSLSLIDAVLPDIVPKKQQQMIDHATANNRIGSSSKSAPLVSKSKSNDAQQRPATTISGNQQPASLPSNNVISNAPQPIKSSSSLSKPSGSEVSMPPSAPAPNKATNNEDANNSIEIPKSKVALLRGHTADVFACEWHPSSDLLASGSSDGTARIWNLNENSNPAVNPMILKHCLPRNSEVPINNDVSSLDWNSDGTFLATASHDGSARIWTTDGRLVSILSQHKGPIFTVKWNKKGNYLLSTSVDSTSVIWDVSTGLCAQQFAFHSSPSLDIDWQSDTIFASCSIDRSIHVGKLGCDRPIKTFNGHKHDINAIKWDPKGNFLASCSDDTTLKIWSLKHDNYIYNMRDHYKEVYTIRWSPFPAILASASFDSTARLWEIDRGLCLYNLAKHKEPVYGISFSPDGKLLASGGYDKWVHIWTTSDGQLVNSFKATDGVFEVCWNARGDKLAVATSGGSVFALDLRRLPLQ